MAEFDIRPALDAITGFFKAIPSVTNFLADLLTVVLATITLWGLYTHKDDISTLFKFVRNRRRSQLVNQVRSCLRTIEDANGKRAGRETAVHNSLGELSGLLRNLRLEFSEFESSSSDVDKLVDSGAIPTAAVIKRLTTELGGLLDRSEEKEVAVDKEDL